MKTIFYSTAFGLVLFFVSVNIQQTRLPILGQVGEFNFTKSDSSQFSSTELDRKVWIFNLFFTSCQGPCPLITANLKNIYQDYLGDPNFAMVSLSVDPQRDTPEKLLAYARRFNVDPLRWLFIVGSEQEIREVALNQFKLAAPEDVQIHSNRVVLIDENRNIRGYYLGIVPEDIEKLKKDINQLL